MTEKELIAKIKELRQIKPREDWVLFTKKELFKDESRRKWLSVFRPEVNFIFRHRPVFATLVILLVLIGVFGFAQNSVPGDSLFPLKKIAEESEKFFASEKNEARINLELVNRRLDDLEKIAESNQTQKLASAITEYQESVNKAAESLAGAEPKEIVEQVKQLEEKERKIKSYGVEIAQSSEELKDVLSQITEREIQDLEKRSLTPEQEKLLEEIKEDYKAGKYSQALEKILILSNINE